jgi:DNA-damage-inducible protein J
MTKKHQSEALEALHETVTGLYRLGLIDKNLFSETLIPNDKTIEAMKAARGDELTTAGTPDRLLEKLDEED